MGNSPSEHQVTLNDGTAISVTIKESVTTSSQEKNAEAVAATTEKFPPNAPHIEIEEDQAALERKIRSMKIKVATIFQSFNEVVNQKPPKNENVYSLFPRGAIVAGP